MQSKTIVFLSFTSDDKCAYLPNERRIQMLEGKPVFPHDGLRYSYIVTNFIFKRVKKKRNRTFAQNRTLHSLLQPVPENSDAVKDCNLKFTGMSDN
jgi:hypothetical protein